MRLFTITAAFLFQFQLHAQYDDLLRNPKVTWIAEYTADFELNPVYNDQLEEGYNLLQLIRLETSTNPGELEAPLETNFYFSELILNGLNKGAFSCYADEGLQQPLLRTAIDNILHKRDTTPSFDHPGEILVHQRDLLSEDIALFRARMVVYYQENQRTFGSRLLALAPLVGQTDETGDFSGRKPALWIAVKPGSASLKKLHKDAGYIMQTYMKENVPEWSQLDVKKGDLDIQKWATREVEAPSHTTLSYETFRPIDRSTLHDLVYTRDTISTLNDEGQAVIDRILEKNAIDLVEKVRFVHNWYYDERRQALDCRLIAVAPLATMRDPDGIPRYDKPLFYIRY